jgi:hypothetical protein
MVGIKAQYSNQGDGTLLEEEMAKLPKFTLTHNEKKDRWDLTKDGASRPAASFDTKSDATKGGALEKAVGKDGGSVKIQKVDGQFQEERTYPRAADPKKSPG